MIQFIVNLILLILVCILYISIYLWIEELKKQGCDCATLKWHTDFLRITSIILLVNTLLFNIVRFSIVKRFGLLNFLPKYSYHLILTWALLTLPLGITYMAILLDYILKLKEKENCKCSEDWKREYGYYFTIIYITYISLILIVGFFTYLTYLFLNNNLSKL
tara:strand:- start:5136 stop:5621 length:486 start_codon:yes stop_codon:yes gene_type:complete